MSYLICMNYSLIWIKLISKESYKNPNSYVDDEEQEFLQIGHFERAKDHEHIEHNNCCSDRGVLLQSRFIHGKPVTVEISFVEHLDERLDKEGISDDWRVWLSAQRAKTQEEGDETYRRDGSGVSWLCQLALLSCCLLYLRVPNIQSIGTFKHQEWKAEHDTILPE